MGWTRGCHPGFGVESEDTAALLLRHQNAVEPHVHHPDAVREVANVHRDPALKLAETVDVNADARLLPGLQTNLLTVDGDSEIGDRVESKEDSGIVLQGTDQLPAVHLGPACNPHQCRSERGLAGRLQENHGGVGPRRDHRVPGADTRGKILYLHPDFSVESVHPVNRHIHGETPPGRKVEVGRIAGVAQNAARAARGHLQTKIGTRLADRQPVGVVRPRPGHENPAAPPGRLPSSGAVNSRLESRPYPGPPSSLR